MKHKLMAILCCCLILLTFSGCQLAQENEGTDTAEDSLVGLFITTEYLDLWDFEGQLTDSIRDYPGGEIFLDGNMQEYQERLYATLVTETYIDEETGETIESGEYVFEGVQGILFMSVLMENTVLAGDYYHSGITGDEISDGQFNITHGDGEDIKSLVGTIYTTPKKETTTFFFNPIYQSADGSIYTMAGEGFMTNNDVYSEGEMYSQAISQEITITENGKAKVSKVSVELSIKVRYGTEKVVLLQMDGENMPIAQKLYQPSQLPEEFIPEASAEYIIVETYKRDDMGEQKISREIYGKDDESFEVFQVKDDGICIKLPVFIQWAEEFVGIESLSLNA